MPKLLEYLYFQIFAIVFHIILHRIDLQIQQILLSFTARYKCIQVIFVQNYALAKLYAILSDKLCRDCCT